MYRVFVFLILIFPISCGIDSSTVMTVRDFSKIFWSWKKNKHLSQSGPVVVQVKGSVTDFRLVKDYKYFWLHSDSEIYQITIFKGLVFDFASVPRPLWGVFPPQSYTEESLVHDVIYFLRGDITNGYKCTNNGRKYGVAELKVRASDGSWLKSMKKFTIEEADQLFLKMLEENNVNPAVRGLMWTAVRVGAHWKKRDC